MIVESVIAVEQEYTLNNLEAFLIENLVQIEGIRRKFIWKYLKFFDHMIFSSLWKFGFCINVGINYSPNQIPN